MKWVFRIAIVVIVGALVAGVFGVFRTQPADVDVATAERAPLEQTVVNDGVTRVRERYTVSAPVAGTLARIDLHEGAVVAPGAVLARLLPLPSPLLDPRAHDVADRRLASAIDAQRQAQATVERAAAAEDEAKRELARTQELSAKAAIPLAELDRAQVEARVRAAELASAQFAARVAAHAIEESRAALETFTPGGKVSQPFEITSPVHGKILHVLHQS